MALDGGFGLGTAKVPTWHVRVAGFVRPAVTPEEAVKRIAALARDIDEATPEMHGRAIIQNVQELAQRVKRAGRKAA